MWAKTLFECLYLVLGLLAICALSQLSVCSHPPTIYSTTISRSPCNSFPRMAPQFFCHHESPSSLTESRYPKCRPEKSFVAKAVRFSKKINREEEIQNQRIPPPLLIVSTKHLKTRTMFDFVDAKTGKNLIWSLLNLQNIPRPLDPVNDPVRIRG